MGEVNIKLDTSFDIFLKPLLCLDFYAHFLRHCFICRLSDSTVSEDAGIEHKTVATSALAVRHTPTPRLDRITRWNFFLRKLTAEL